MTEKEATVYIIDVGKSMGTTRSPGRDISDLEWTLVYVWDKITTIIALERKTTFQAVVALRSDHSNNDLLQDSSYKNIDVLQDFKALQRHDLKELQKRLVPSNTSSGDAIDAIVVAIDMITKHCKKLKYKRRIVLATDGRGRIDPDQAGDISEKLKDEDIELIVLGVDFDDQEYGFQETDKPERKAKNEELLKKLAEDSKGVFGTLAQAIDELGQPRVKTTRPIASFKGTLSIGNPQNKYGSSLVIPVERYPKVMVRKPPSASTVRPNAPQQQTQSSVTLLGDNEMDIDPLGGATTIQSERNYFVDDESQPGGRRDVDYEELVRGYEYGRSIVPLSASEQDITRLETEPCLDILGFVSSVEFPRQMLMTTSHIIVGAKGDAEAAMALSSLVHALSELEDYAVARFVAKKDKAPLVVLLAPLIEPDHECLVELELPFAEDVRTYRFAPLDKILTVSGKEIKEHAKLPNQDLQQAMNDYVDRMDLTVFGDDEEGNPTEYGKIEDIYSPLLHRLDQAVRWRATHESREIPATYPVLLKYSTPPADLVAAASSQLSSLQAAAKVEKVPPQAKARRAKATTNPISGLDIASILEPASSIDANNSIPSFERTINPPPNRDLNAPGPDPNRLEKASASLGRIIEQRITSSFGSAAYERALEEMGHLRARLDELEEAPLWNEWITQLKSKIAKDELGGQRLEFWLRVRESRLGLLFVPPRRLAGVSSAEMDAARETWVETSKNFWSLK